MGIEQITAPNSSFKQSYQTNNRIELWSEGRRTHEFMDDVMGIFVICDKYGYVYQTHAKNELGGYTYRYYLASCQNYQSRVSWWRKLWNMFTGSC